jgi:hypothetical protein
MMLSSVHMRFDGDERVYRYPWTHPKYYPVRFYTVNTVDIWVNKDDLDRNDGEPIVVWALEERNPQDKPEEQTIVTYQNTIDMLEQNASRVVNLGEWMGWVFVISLTIGVWNLLWNRRNFPALKRPDNHTHGSAHITQS